jgi:hypothetical protein
MPVRKGCLRPTLSVDLSREQIQRWPVPRLYQANTSKPPKKPRQDWLAEFWNRAACWSGMSGSPRRVEGNARPGGGARQALSLSCLPRTVKPVDSGRVRVGRGRSPGVRGVPFGAAWRAGCCWAPWSAFRSPGRCLCMNRLGLRSSISKPANSGPSRSSRSFFAFSAILRRSRRARPTLHDVSCILQPWGRLPGRRCGRPGAPGPPG